MRTLSSMARSLTGFVLVLRGPMRRVVDLVALVELDYMLKFFCFHRTIARVEAAGSLSTANVGNADSGEDRTSSGIGPRVWGGIGG